MIWEVSEQFFFGICRMIQSFPIRPKEVENGMKKSKLLTIVVVVLLALVLFNSLSRDQQGTAISTVSDIVEIFGSEQTDTPKSDLPSADQPSPAEEAPTASGSELTVREDGEYDSKEEVALYIHLYGHLPSNYISKSKAEKAGWPGGSLEEYCPGKCIGGSRFGNYEGILPEKDGRKWTECDIDTLGARSRGVKRIVFSNDGLIYYTEDHYESFELLYGEP